MRINRQPNQNNVKTITKLVLSGHLAESLKISVPKSQPIIQGVVDALIALLTDGRSVILKGAGVLSTKQKSERPGRNPKTGEPHLITARKVINLGHQPNNKNRAGIGEICDIISTLANVSHTTSRAAFDILLTSLRNVSYGNYSVEIRGLGTFYYTEHFDTLKRNPKTGEPVLMVGKHTYIKFKASKLLLDSINGRSL